MNIYETFVSLCFEKSSPFSLRRYVFLRENEPRALRVVLQVNIMSKPGVKIDYKLNLF